MQVALRALTPEEARLRNLVYAANVYLDMNQEVYKVFEDGEKVLVNSHLYSDLFIGKLPVMLRSQLCYLHKLDDAGRVALNECRYDQGGYFIVNGTEKVLIAQERMASNMMAVQRDNYYATSVFSLQLTAATQGKGSRIVVTLPYIRAPIPLCVLFRALGIESDRGIVERILHEFDDQEMYKLLLPSFQDVSSELTYLAALDYIGKRGPTLGAAQDARIRYAQDLLDRELFAHIGVSRDLLDRKSWFLGDVVYRLLLRVLNREQEDDRDHFARKRIELAGVLIASSFGTFFFKLMKDVGKSLRRYIENNRAFDLASIVRTLSPITHGLKYQIATGNWGRNKEGNVVRTGVSQVVNRLTYMSALSHLRRLNTPLGRDGKFAKPRQLHNTHWGMICPAETPEGQAVGLVKNLALACRVTVGFSPEPVIELLKQAGMRLHEDCTVAELQTTARVFVNGVWVGCYASGAQIANLLRYVRRQGEIDSETSIVYNMRLNEVRILTDGGRTLRPLFVVENNNLSLTRYHVASAARSESPWQYLLNRGFVEFLDCAEEEVSMIAMFVTDLHTDPAQKNVASYTHCEIHPSLIFGVCASLIPFPDHNQSPRNVYQSAMGKQAIGVYMSNFGIRFDSSAHVLFYTQKPLVCTRGVKYFKFKNIPSGVNCIVAICCYTGYNQEDSLIMSQSAIERGLFRSMFLRTYVAEERLRGSVLIEQFEKPDPTVCAGLKRGDYGKLEDDGLVSPGCFVLGDDIIIGKTLPIPAAECAIGKKSKRDASTILRSNENGVIDSVLLSCGVKGTRFAKVKVRSIRVPQIGDKFASRHGQKGTIGFTLRQEDLPFSPDGITPDLLMNPHAVPSRMTIGHLVECFLGKYYSVVGGEGDATPFCGQSVKQISEWMMSIRFHRYGNERLYNGFSGYLLENMIFFGPTYYQRLKHMVDDKVHSRARGPIAALTRQPMEGRLRAGGLRFGEMERDCMISHGAARILKERLFDLSDAYTAHVCDNCGLFAVADLKQGLYSCTGCAEKQQISKVALPYACKLLLQELSGMQIYPRLVLQST
uniref:DNA-directed RNA polymerase subunit beta n=1 Tax=Dermatophagoides pteronyssinus TaxID=6956 RepID=A0A6P6Y512_DERPT|nr:DNA-directed RNA polymerase II subunit rpb2-like [Dermatophagoides pteronyssinus]